MNPIDLTWVWAVWVGSALLLQIAVCSSNFGWQARRMVAGLVAAMYVVSFPLLAVTHFASWFGIGMAAASLYLLINSLRLWMDRFHAAFLRRSVLRDALELSGILAVLAVISEIIRANNWMVSHHYVVGFGLCVSVALAGVLCLRAVQGLREYHAVAPNKKPTRMRNLPTVSLVIPARNETHALEESLTMAIKSDYPKLEILVLDDCSQDATAAVIRSFAHDGVRFVQGNVPAEGWLGKNYACQTLAEEASGDLLIFAAVDTHFDQQSISRLVEYMLGNKAQMLSVVPFRRELDLLPTFFEQLRNFWQVVLPKSAHRLPISSPCWAIWEDDLRRLGGFEAYKNSVVPEVHFARALHVKHAYHFVLSDEQLVVTTRKRLSSQLETATRTSYPLLKRRPAAVLYSGFCLAALLLLPYGLLLWQLSHTEVNSLTALAALSIGGFTAAHLLVLRRTTPRGWVVGLVNFPIVVSLEVLLYNWSMLQFEFGEVNWKGRNVCYPVMQALPMKDFTQQLR